VQKKPKKHPPDKVAVFSDIHSNLEALEAVLADIKAKKITHLVCLGDIVGYNANPVECLERVRALNCPVVQGNHDMESTHDLDLSNYRELARVSLNYTRAALSPEQKKYLQHLPLVLDYHGLSMVHSSLYEPAEFLYVETLVEASIHFSSQDSGICFCGHTHVACIFAQWDEPFELEWNEPVYLEPKVKYLVNVGSVGQPRDRDWRAGYAVYDFKESTVELCRVEYDVEKTAKKINDANLPNELALRLFKGV
jgi:predicted phosphodiesterase